MASTLTFYALSSTHVIPSRTAHRPRGGAVRTAYLRGQFFDERVKMMDWWSDYIGKLME